MKELKWKSRGGKTVGYTQVLARVAGHGPLTLRMRMDPYNC